VATESLHPAHATTETALALQQSMEGSGRA
jgi:hypothetical protein